jgi:DNA-binding transcriptional LysR family regulator
MTRFRYFDQLRSFVVVAESLSMTKAADELFLTKGAVSHQIRILEQELGFLLFKAHRRKLSLTLEGARLYRIASVSFENIEQEIQSFQRQSNEHISIGMATYFAARWLSPRLMRFITSHPNIGLRIQPLVDLSDWHANDLDMAIRWGNGQWHEPGMTIEPVFHCPTLLTVEYSAKNFIESNGISAAIKHYELLHDSEDSRAWSDWFQAASLETIAARHNLVIPDPNVRVQAVVDGQGIALYDELVADELRQEKLYQYKPVQLQDYGYYLIYKKQTRLSPAMQEFHNWLLTEAELWRKQSFSGMTAS